MVWSTGKQNFDITHSIYMCCIYLDNVCTEFVLRLGTQDTACICKI